jgi:hypothetical protein
MNTLKFAPVMMLSPLLALSCKTSDKQSSLQDIGVINASKSEVGVVYEDNGTVYYKRCKPPTANPNRNCASEKQPQSMRLDEYIYKLPYDVGTLERTDQAMAMIAKSVDDARAAVQAGNQAAAETLKVIEPRKLNLEAILRIRDALGAQNRDLTYYEYNKEFEKITAPFATSTSQPGDDDYTDSLAGFPAGVQLTTTRSVSIPANSNYERDWNSNSRKCLIRFDKQPYDRVLSPGVVITFSGKLKWGYDGTTDWYHVQVVPPTPSVVREIQCSNLWNDKDGLLNALRYYGNIQIPPPAVIGQ